MNNCKKECVDCLFKSDAVSVLNNEELGFLDKSCYTNEYKKGELIFKERTPVQHIVYLRRGFVKLMKTGVGGMDYILSISKPGSYLGIQNLTKGNKTNFFSAKAITDSEVCHIGINCFYDLLKMNGAFAIEVITTIVDDEMSYFERLVNNVQQQVPGRLASALFYFRNQVYNQNPFDLNLSRSELASLVGSSREGLSRILKEFNDEKIIKLQKNSIEIINEGKLQEIKMKG